MAGKANKRERKTSQGNRSLADIAYEAIKQQIITLKFEPGGYLNEAAISELIGIGRTPVHHAIQRLTLDGMLETIPRKGLIVKPVSLKEVMEIIEIRLINEIFCVRLAARRASDQDIEAMRSILEEAVSEKSMGDLERQMLIDRDFHCAISRASGNHVLADILLNLHERSLRFWFISLTDDHHRKAVRREHEQILQAISKHDPDAAADAMHSHIEAFRKNVSQFI